MKIQELIDKLEMIKKDVMGSPHPDIDNVYLSIANDSDEFDNLELEIVGFDYHSRWGCMCPENCIIEIIIIKKQ